MADEAEIVKNFEERDRANQQDLRYGVPKLILFNAPHGFLCRCDECEKKRDVPVRRVPRMPVELL